MYQNSVAISAASYILQNDRPALDLNIGPINIRNRTIKIFSAN